jgi:membrane-bound lytic murein transglycosylase D
MMTIMQILINRSKNILFNALSGFLIVWCGFSISTLDWSTVSVDSGVVLSGVASAKTVDAQSSQIIWDSLSSELNLDHKQQSVQVQAEIHKLLAEPNKLYSILKAAGPYIYFIHQQTQARGLPAEIALIPVIESEFNPNDKSTKGATGLWQLMPSTATGLGIKVHSGYDGRRNVIASTKGALTYFNDLGNNFKGNWYLAIAAYNCGSGCVQSAERRKNSNDFWDLKLPKETRLYVPKLLAVAAIVKNPAKYGVQLPPIQNAPFFTELKTKKSLSLQNVAKTSGIDVALLHSLNPDYNHGLVPNKNGYSLLVPISKASALKTQLSVVNL